MRALAAGRADEDAVSLVPGSFEAGYIAEDGPAHRVALTDAWAVRFEATAPVRRFYSRTAQRHLPGRWWSATEGVHVGYESWLDHLIAMDFDQAVVGIASQPFWLFWVADGKVRSHAPVGGSGVGPGPRIDCICRQAACGRGPAGISYGCCPDLVPGRGAPPLPVIGPVHPGRWTVLAAARAALRSD